MEYLSPPTTPCKNKRKSINGFMNVGKSFDEATVVPSKRRNKLNEKLDFSNDSLSKPMTGLFSNEEASPMTPDRSERKERSASAMDSTAKNMAKSGDRFIPNRSVMVFDYCHHEAYQDKDNFAEEKSLSSSKYYQCIMESLSPPRNRRLLPLFEASDSPPPVSSPFRGGREIDSQSKSPLKKQLVRNLPMIASRVLDAPDLVDDYYLNLLHWGSSNSLAVALGSSVYLWNASNGQVNQLLTLGNESEYVGSVKWSTTQSNTLAVGTSNNTIEIWDAKEEKLIREMTGHSARVSSLSWNGDIVSSGSKDSLILNHDIRQRRNVVSRYCGHQQEVCGLAWSMDGTTLVSP
jgi:cell division cycle 20, cofactor of APC complex